MGDRERERAPLKKLGDFRAPSQIIFGANWRTEEDYTHGNGTRPLFFEQRREETAR